jgi:hypothetical protein
MELKLLTRILLLITLFWVAPNAYAYSSAPTLSLTSLDTDSVQVRVSADARSSITLSYTDSSGRDKNLPLGTTDTEGYVSHVVSTSENKIVPGSLVHAVSGKTGGISTSLHWPFTGSTNISFPTASVPIPVGQNGPIEIVNPISAALKIQTNSDPSVVSSTLNGNKLHLAGLKDGTVTVTVCVSDGSNCADLSVIVGKGVTATSGLSVSQTDPVVIIGKSVSIYISGASHNYYLSSNSAPNIAQANVTQNLVMITGSQIGTAQIKICSPDAVCSMLSVTVLPDTNVKSGTGIVLSRDALDIAVGEQSTVLVAGSGSFTVTSNNAQVATSTLMRGSNVIVVGKSIGTATIQVCRTTDVCEYISVTVHAAPIIVPAPIPTPVIVPGPHDTPATPPVSSVKSYVFTKFLKVGSKGAEVTELQKKLTALGVYKGAVTGQTAVAVKKLQAAHSIKAAGFVGPGTRSLLNK